RFKKVLNSCKMRNVNFHTLRHTYATMCIENGFDAKTLSEILGHSDVSITLNRYVHSSEKMQKYYVNQLEFIS
ncbi:MAG: tyrosine-type recombinase/integrase, partial [Clostridiales bacterium]|nr:tyrosine-type recombinase/integrase [Clostridiales bacterium]